MTPPAFSSHGKTNSYSPQTRVTQTEQKRCNEAGVHFISRCSHTV